jgi:hypothetical protein
VLIGTIVAPSVRAYVAEHAADAKVTEAVVDSIDCNVLEFSVANDMLFPVFRSIHPDLLRVPNVTLRLSISKRMGCVLVRYELVSPNGASYHVIESADIANIGDNVYVPRRWKRTRQRKASALIEEIELVSAEYVNAALPDSAFEFNVPASTRVADQRPGRPSRIFTLKDGVSLGAIDNAVADELPPKVIPIASPKERSDMIYLVVFNGLCIVVLALVICKRVLSKGK